MFPHPYLFSHQAAFEEAEYAGLHLPQQFVVGNPVEREDIYKDARMHRDVLEHFFYEKEIAPAVTLDYGQFLQATFDFLIIAFAIFLFIRLITKLTTKKQAEVAAAPPTPPAPTKEEVLLTEIRDLLKEKNS